MEEEKRSKVVIPCEIGVSNLANLLKNSVGVWMDPQFLNLVATMSSPSSAYEEVFRRTSSKRKAKAARKFAIAVRDYDPLVVRGAIDFLRESQLKGKEKYLGLEKYLRSQPEATLTHESGDVAILKEKNDPTSRIKDNRP